MIRIFIVHGWSGRPDSGWLLWIRKLLEKKYHVVSLEMPDKDYPKINKWVNHLRNSVKTTDKDTYFIGHSIGCQTIIRFLSTQKNKSGGAVFVAGWFKLNGLEKDQEKIVAPWLKSVNIIRAKKNLLHSTALFSDNDPYVPLSNTTYFKILGSKIVIEKKKGHYIEDKTLRIPLLLKEINNMIKNNK